MLPAAPRAIHVPPMPPALCPPVLHARSLRLRRPPLRPHAARVPPPPSASAPPPLLLRATAMLRTAAPAPRTAHVAVPHAAAAAAQCSQGVRHIARATFCTACASRSRSHTLASRSSHRQSRWVARRGRERRLLSRSPSASGLAQRERGREGRDGGQGRRGAGIKPCSSVQYQGAASQGQGQRSRYG